MNVYTFKNKNPIKIYLMEYMSVKICLIFEKFSNKLDNSFKFAIK